MTQGMDLMADAFPSMGADKSIRVMAEGLSPEEQAELLGFATYADLSLARKCAPSVAAVHAMLDALAAASKPVKAREDADLAAFAKTKLEPWDRSFWSERQREKLYSYSEEELMQYFNFPDVLKGLFGLAERLFGVKI